MNNESSDLQHQVQLLNDKVYGKLEYAIDELDAKVHDISNYVSNNTVIAGYTSSEVATVSYVNERINEVLNESGLTKLYHNIFDVLCENKPKNKTKYNALLKIYGGDYRSAVIVIETMNIKEEKEKLFKDLS